MLPQWLSGLLEEMDERENFVAGLPRLLALAHMSQEHLTRSFRRYLGVTPTAFINAKRLGLAAELLLTTETPVIDVGGLCGFNSQSRFYRLFRRALRLPAQGVPKDVSKPAGAARSILIIMFLPAFSSTKLTVLFHYIDVKMPACGIER